MTEDAEDVKTAIEKQWEGADQQTKEGSKTLNGSE
jgi:hypothetical protein